MKPIESNKKPKFKYTTPKPGDRYKFPESKEEDEEIKNMIESKKIFGRYKGAIRNYTLFMGIGVIGERQITSSTF